MSEQVETFPELPPIPEHYTCASCGNSYDTGTEITAFGEVFCEDCFNERYVSCEECNAIIAVGSSLTHENEYGIHVFCNGCYRIRVWCCGECGESWMYDVLMPQEASNRTPLCESCWGELCVLCDICNSVIWQNDARYDDNGIAFCQRCNNEYQQIANTTFIKNTSLRKVGFELEYCSASTPRVEQYGKIKGDGSIVSNEEDVEGREFASHVVSGDSLLTTINKVCTQMESAGAYVNSTCGFHVHFDMLQESTIARENVKAWWRVLEPIFFDVVTLNRRTNSYCKPVQDCDGDWESDRYTALNIAAFHKHRTFEVRMHHGTLNREKITTWCLVLLRFFDTFSQVDATLERIDLVRNMNRRERLIFLFSQVAMPLSLRKQMVKRYKRYKNHHLLTKRDKPVTLAA